MNWFDCLESLIQTPSVVGHERPLLQLLVETLEPLNLDITYLHGLLAVSGKDPNSLFISAHSDRHGLVCTGPNEFQYAAFITRYRQQLDGNSISEQTYTNLLERFIDKDVHAYNPWTGENLGQGIITDAIYGPRRRNAVFSVSGLERCPVGAPITYEQHLVEKDGFLSGQLDNVICVALAVEMFFKGFQGTVLFTREEEAGRSWISLEDFFHRRSFLPEKMLTLDTSPYQERDNACQQEVLLRNRDANSSFSKNLNLELEKHCKKNEISFAYKDEFVDQVNKERKENGWELMSYGRTELGRFLNAMDKPIYATTLQVPTTGYHTNMETVSIQSVEAMSKLLESFIN